MRLKALTITLEGSKLFFTGALEFGQEQASGVAAKLQNSLPLRHCETPPESYRHAYQLCSVRWKALTITLEGSNRFFTGALGFGQEQASGVAAKPQNLPARGCR